jgi:hypothetical protein
MNVLILTPDAVGSTLLQRMLTIYMQLHDFARPVINLHELTNGLNKYYSPEFNCEIVSKKSIERWGYYQTLEQVVELLSSVDHYKTSRLAHYHIKQRGDSIDQQIPFYKYLNENFYIIACQRTNVFEHALSMTLSKITKKLNVYDAYDKIETFYELYKSGVTLDPTVFIKQLDAYKLYIDWSEQYFEIGCYFNYENDVPRLEEYILKLPVFASQSTQITWNSTFGISFNDWNKLHFVRSDPNNLTLPQQDVLKKLIYESSDQVTEYQQHAHQSWPTVYSSSDLENLPVEIKQQWAKDIIQRDGITRTLPPEKQQLVAQYKQSYNQAQTAINQMIDLGIIINGPPIKKQTLSDKKKVILNFDQLIDLYNQWAVENSGIATPMSDQTITDKISNELDFWSLITNPSQTLPAVPPTQQ